jgi:hypothetical protein
MGAAGVQRLRALMRLLMDSGDITPEAVRQVEKILQEEEW